MIDQEGYRPNVAIVLANRNNKVLWAKRIRQQAWQFPQGGIQTGEEPIDAMYRELHEEVGLRPHHVRVLGQTRDWLHYEVPRDALSRNQHGHYRGQKQIWFLLRLIGTSQDICLQTSSKPEFDAWRWGDWDDLQQVIYFKHDVYKSALLELQPLLCEQDTHYPASPCHTTR